MTRTRTPRRGGQTGLTLIEVLVSLIILGIISTMLVMGWANLQRASATAMRTNHARASLRDAMSRISKELRGAQPTALPTTTATSTPSPLPLLTLAAPTEVRFYSAFNSADANLDGSGTDALRLTRLWLDTGTVPPAPWNPNGRTLYWQRDMDGNGSFTDPDDRSIILARNVANEIVPNTLTGTSYTAVFTYGYRPTKHDPVQWTDNQSGSLDLSSVVALAVRLVIDKKMGGTPNYADLTTTVRLRNAGAQ